MILRNITKWWDLWQLLLITLGYSVLFIIVAEDIKKLKDRDAELVNLRQELTLAQQELQACRAGSILQK
jgi:hypothetical protein